ncbi:tetratricopeptide repeat protein [Sphingomonas naphthae]|uniref:Tetratricopeptide repeat protein n=1 Tax=Sphingomonas naphthae TaxID=1813468 RepID=A0ABY7TQ74_9SPHN|nr:tetratricopeptide repeat protein [Sphingomonas naphthae]WCT74004.1 tetratricopeptide repeat protein [Sphingomonas naphthae]
MRLKWKVILAASVCLASPAFAADKILFAPPPAWVQRKAIKLDDGKDGAAAVRFLLQDQQVRLDPDAQTVFAESYVKIQTSEGLAVGAVNLAWRPETEALTVNGLQIHRGGKVIDVLAAGQQFTILRREQNLEQATLDGTLTATLQPEGLQVGDVLHLTTTMRRSDPVLKGHVEFAAMPGAGMPMNHVGFRADWPSAVKVRVRQTQDLPRLAPEEKAGRTGIALALDDLQPLLLPRGAPRRFQIGRLIEASDFADWAAMAALMKPYFDTASAIPATGPLRAELDRIAKASTDPKARAEAALSLVQTRIRYVNLAMGAGGYVPASAEQTWSRRFGDCKGKSALLLGLLRALGVQADAVLVNSGGGDAVAGRLPALGVFNHVIVRAVIGGKTYWLDGTRPNDPSLDRIETPDLVWGLPLAAGADLVAIRPEPYAEPVSVTKVRIDASAGIHAPAPFHGETILRGDEALGVKYMLANSTPAQRDEAMRDGWRSSYDYIEAKSVAATYDDKTGIATMTVDGTAKLDWSNANTYQPDNVGVGYRADFTRTEGPDRDAPFAVGFPAFSRTEETMLLPSEGFTLGNAADVDQTVAATTYTRRARIEGKTFTVVRTERTLAPEFPAKDAPTAQAVLRALAGRFLYVKKPAGYRPTAKDREAMLARTPETAAQFIERAALLEDQGNFPEALAASEAALAIEPDNVHAAAVRASYLAMMGRIGDAEKVLTPILATHPDNPVVMLTHARLLHEKGNFSEADVAYSKILNQFPKHKETQFSRARVRYALSRLDDALSDARQTVVLWPENVDAYILQANILMRQKKNDEVPAVIQALVTANPSSGYAHVAAAKSYHRLGRSADAMREFDAAAKVEQAAYIYINRAIIRPRSDHANRLADLEKALSLEPKDVNALMARAELASEMKDYETGIALWTRIIADIPQEPDGLIGRATQYALAGRVEDADRDFTAARAMKRAGTLNNLCWAKATNNILLESALADCNAQIAEAPNASGYIDSLGLILFRLGRFDEALAAYDKALTSAPRQSSSLFGRGLVHAAKGETSKANADFAAAVEANGLVEGEFASYGLTRTGPFPAPAPAATPAAK